mgnify:CR=1 FL=1
MNIRIVNQSKHQLPAYETIASAGMDLRAHLEEKICIQALERVLIPTGLFIELPVGFEAQIRPRSGLAFKYGISVLNTPGTIDADYRGEIKVILILNNRSYSDDQREELQQMAIKSTIERTIKEIEVNKNGNTNRVYYSRNNGFYRVYSWSRNSL